MKYVTEAALVSLKSESVIDRLGVRVLFVAESAVWCWEIVTDDELLESSWQHYWEAFPTAREARTFGLLRIGDLVRSARLARARVQPNLFDDAFAS